MKVITLCNVTLLGLIYEYSNNNTKFKRKKCPIHVINQVKGVNIISPKNQYLVVNFLFTLLKRLFNVLILGY